MTDPVNGADPVAAHTATEAAANPQNDYRWTPAAMRVFLEALACGGSVTSACKEAAKSPRSAYTLRFRRDGGAFALGWDAAIQIARVSLADMLMDRAIHGYEEETRVGEDGVRVRHKTDNRLGLNLLVRLDRMAEAQAGSNGRASQVQLVMQDFDSYLDLISGGGGGAQAAAFCMSRMASENYIIPGEEYKIECELKRISEEEDRKSFHHETCPMTELEPEDAAQRLHIWYDECEEAWFTNFPVPQGYDGEDLEEHLTFGEPCYHRNLTAEESALHIADQAAEHAPYIAAAHAARDAWFDELRQDLRADLDNDNQDIAA
jgi:hypothetical protein